MPRVPPTDEPLFPVVNPDRGPDDEQVIQHNLAFIGNQLVELNECIERLVGVAERISQHLYDIKHGHGPGGGR